MLRNFAGTDFLPWTLVKDVRNSQCVIELHASSLLTHSMEQSPSFEANRFAASQKIPLIIVVSEEHRNSSPR